MTDRTPFANYQNEIYLRGLADELPAQPLAYDELERKARETLDPGPYGYVAGGAGLEDTMKANRAAFERWRIVPRFLRDVKDRDLSTSVIGTPMRAPLLLAPIGVQSIVHPDGELASARAAASLDVPFIMSTASSFPIEEVAEANGNGRRWYQLYWPGDRDLAASFVHRAEASGFEVLVVTIDTFMLAWRPRDLQLAYLPFLRATGIANYVSDPVFNKGLPDENREQAQILKFVGLFNDPSLTWDDLAWLREQTRLPIVLKGIQHPHDARRALDHGMEGIVVSNHGGRQVDGALGSLDALPAIVDAVGDRLAVLFDSGIRSGADAFKALALGARAVLLGRPYMWGLALRGEDGVATVIRSFLAELDLTLGLSGYCSFAEVGRDALQKI
ncbi:MAG: lactate 2-monooxygenase [Actinomycetota bacterium]